MNNIQALAITNPDVAFVLQENEALKEENQKLRYQQRDLEDTKECNEALEDENRMLKMQVARLEARENRYKVGAVNSEKLIDELYQRINRFQDALLSKMEAK